MTPDLHIRLASKADAREIAAISRDLIENGLPWNWGAERVAGAINASNTNVAVVCGHSKPDGFGIMEYWDDDAHLVLLAIHPARQRQRIGSALLWWLERSAQVAGSRRIRVEARMDNGAARNFYCEHNYHEVRIKPKMYSGILDGIYLEKWLPESAAGDA